MWSYNHAERQAMHPSIYKPRLITYSQYKTGAYGRLFASKLPLKSTPNNREWIAWSLNRQLDIKHKYLCIWNTHINEWRVDIEKNAETIDSHNDTSHLGVTNSEKSISKHCQTHFHNDYMRSTLRFPFFTPSQRVAQSYISLLPYPCQTGIARIYAI